jgi:hypothetical protein
MELFCGRTVKHVAFSMQMEQIVLEYAANTKLPTDDKFSRRLKRHLKHETLSVKRTGVVDW